MNEYDLLKRKVEIQEEKITELELMIEDLTQENDDLRDLIGQIRQLTWNF